jgi:hypothetical protein
MVMSDSLPQLEKECFVISPIGSDGSPERERSDGVLEFIIGRAAGELGLTAVRGDQLAEPGQITPQVVDHVLGARAAVADLTGLNPNVFYELAIRHTARLPVALIAERGCELPFDIAQMRTIFFDSTKLKSSDQCRQDIVSHLRRAFDGAVDSPIATSIDVRAMAGGSVAERNIAEIVTTVEYVARMQRDIAQAINDLVLDLNYTASSDPGLLEALEDAFARTSALELAPAGHLLPETVQLQAEVHELNEMLRSTLRNRRRVARRASGRPTLRPVAEGAETGVAEKPS